VLANKLKEKLNWPIVHFSKPGPDPALEYGSFFKGLGNIICDRFYIGELVYGPLLRGKQTMSQLQMTVIERLCRLHAGILIHVNPPYTVIAPRLEELGDDAITSKQNLQAYKIFQAICPLCKVLHLFEWDGTSIEHATETITTFVKELIIDAGIGISMCTGIGTIIGPKYVFVGEALNHTTTWLGHPFDGGPCAEYLQRAMQLSGIDERKVYVCNANTFTKQEVVFLISTGETKFIALGNVAYDKLKKLGVNSIKIAHPQYFKRFKYHLVSDYANDIFKATKEAPIYNVYSSIKQYC